MKHKLIYLLTCLMFVLIAAACSATAGKEPQGSTVSALTQEEAAAIIDTAMQGYKDGNYTAWSSNWSDAMKNAISEKDFLGFRTQLNDQVGQLVSIGLPEISPGARQGYVRWSTVCTFEKGKVRFNFSFSSDGKLVEGVFSEAVQ